MRRLTTDQSFDVRATLTGEQHSCWRFFPHRWHSVVPSRHLIQLREVDGTLEYCAGAARDAMLRSHLRSGDDVSLPQRISTSA